MAHLRLLCEECVDLQRIDEEDHRRVVEVLRPRRVVVPIKLDNILVSCIFGVECLTVRGQDEVVLLSRAEKRGDKAVLHVGNRRQIVDIKAGLLLDCALDEAHCSADEDFRHFRVCGSQLVAQFV